MNESTLVEEPVLRWLTGKDGAANALGGEYRDAAAMSEYGRPRHDPLVEPLLVEAVRRINPAVATDEQARRAVEVLRRAMNQPDPLAANRDTLDLLGRGIPLVLTPGEPAKDMLFVATEPDRQRLNSYVATNQYAVQGVRNCRDDTALLVNGVPLAIAEFKSHLTSGKDWREAVKQLHRYRRQAPAMLAPNVFCVAADEHDLRFGTILHHASDGPEVARYLNSWGRWLSQYPEEPNYWAKRGVEDTLELAVRGLLRLAPCHVVDYLRKFVVFETRKGKTVKKVARYQQFEAANRIVDRTVELYKQPDVTPQDRTGLIWHTQGSGKSLTMIFAAQKLWRHPEAR